MLSAELHPREDHGRSEDLAPDGGIYRSISAAGLVLVIPITLCIVTEMGLAMLSLSVLVIVGQVQSREVYRLTANLDPKLNAALLIAKAKTGLNVQEIVEIALLDYLSRRK